jgi:hypothetical protein
MQDEARLQRYIEIKDGVLYVEDPEHPDIPYSYFLECHRAWKAVCKLIDVRIPDL